VAIPRPNSALAFELLFAVLFSSREEVIFFFFFSLCELYRSRSYADVSRSLIN
jgi:hypothetical protein